MSPPCVAPVHRAVSRPLLVQAATSAGLYGVGDLLAQSLAAAHAHRFATRTFDCGRCLQRASYGGEGRPSPP